MASQKHGSSICQTSFNILLCTRYFLVILALILVNNHSTYAEKHDVAIEKESPIERDHNLHRTEGLQAQEIAIDGERRTEETVISHQILPRADTHDIDANDSPNRGNVTAGQTTLWKYSQALLTGQHAAYTSNLLRNITSQSTGAGFGVKNLDLKKRSTSDGYSLDELEDVLDKRQVTLSGLYVSINVCSQPQWNSTATQTAAPPQLTLYVGQSGNDSPGPNSSGQQNIRVLQEGYAASSLQASSDIYIAVTAPSSIDGFQGGWTYDVAVSIDNFYHNAQTGVPFLYLVDTDTTSALLVTDNLTQADRGSDEWNAWMDMKPFPFDIFANPISDKRRLGMMSSYCGLQAVAQMSSSSNLVEPRMVYRGLGSKPKQQFHIGNITARDTWNVSLVMPGNGTRSGKGVVGGGGTAWLSTSYTTKSDGNCQLLYGLDFCENVAYAVPSNPNKYNISALAALYDSNAANLYKNFSYSLAQVPCNTTNDQRYSLARNCDDCDHAYKQWLCAVTIPRCDDFSSNATYLQPRNVGQVFFQNNSMLSDDILGTSYQPMSGAPTLPGSPINQTWISAFATNQSRNAIIDQYIAPGPYKEVLPCEDLCYSLVQSCPASLQFGCPRPGLGLEAGYAPRPNSQSVIECSYLGAVYYIGGASRMVPSLVVVFAGILLALLG